jgi:hypothetical protein
MRKRQLLVLLAAGSLLSAASPAWADGTGFDSEEYEVSEVASYVDLTVHAGMWAEQGRFDYHTSDLTAVAGEDYQQKSGTLWFAGSSSGNIRVPITNDELFEGEERFEVRLTNFTGGFVTRGRETAVVRILDNDAKPSSGSAASSGRSIQQAAESQAASTARSPSLPSSAPSPPGSTKAVIQTDQENPDDLTGPGPNEPSALDGAKPLATKAERDDRRPSFPLPGLGILLIVLIAAGFGLKKTLGRRLT